MPHLEDEDEMPATRPAPSANAKNSANDDSSDDDMPPLEDEDEMPATRPAPSANARNNNNDDSSDDDMPPLEGEEDDDDDMPPLEDESVEDMDWSKVCGFADSYLTTGEQECISHRSKM
jgi:hypothetical protein